MKLRVLDLFSGIGGFSLGLERAGMETVAFCEYDEKARMVLRKHWPDVPIHEDIRRLDGKQYRGAVDVICGGFPCQPFSQAGKRRGKDDDRDLWPEMFRVIQEAEPTLVLGENVVGFVNMELDRTLSDLESEGYEVQAFIIPACAVGAPHRRDRVWIVAKRKNRGGGNADCGCETMANSASQNHNRIAVWEAQLDNGSEDVANSASTGLEGAARSGVQGGIKRLACNSETMADTERLTAQGHGEARQQKPGVGQPNPQTKGGQQAFRERCDWPVEPNVGRVAHGVPGRVDRLKQLGNAVVPQIVEIIGRAIVNCHGSNK